MGLSISTKTEENYCLGKKYNVEYELGNGKRNTFSNTLENADGKYFWFCGQEEGMDVIRQDRVITMVCIREKK